MAEEKNILEEAIIQMKNLEEAVAENAKGILGSVMRQEIKELVKESLNEQEDDEEVDSEEDESDIADVEFEDEDEMDDEDMEDEMDDEDMEDEMDDEDMEDEMDDEDMEDEFEDDEEMEDDEDVTIDLTNEPIENVMKVFSRMKDTDKITVVEDGEGNIELSDDETNKEYYIVREGLDMDEEMYEMDEPIYELEMETDEEMDMMEMDDMDMMEMDDMDMMEMDDIDMMEMDEPIYEIEMDEEMDDSMDEEMDDLMEAKKARKPKGVGIGHGPKFNYGKVMNFPTKKMKKGDEAPYTGKGPKYEFDKKSPSLQGEFKEGKYGMNRGDKSKTHKGEEDYTGKKGMKSKTHKGLDFEKKETKEASRTLGNGKYWGREGLPKPKAAPRHIRKESVESQEVNLLREKNEEYRKALNVFRNKLNEVAIFNSNLAYATRLFTEHSTSKQEKINILKRFDGVETLKESKNLYKIIKDELTPSTGKQVNESIERTIQKSPSNGSSINLIESKTYENPQFLRMKDLMSKLK
jgi:hypothetical protein